MRKQLIVAALLLVGAMLLPFHGSVPSLAQTFQGLVGVPKGCPSGNVPSYDANGLPSVCSATGAGSAFSAITTGTNTAATMTVGSGSTLTFSGSGVINASECNGGSCGGGGGAWTNITDSVTASGCTASSGVCTASAASSVTLSSIPGTYIHLVLIQQVRVSDSAAIEDMLIVLNSDTTSGDYNRQALYANDTTPNGDATGASGILYALVPGSTAPTHSAAMQTTWLPFYAGTTYNKQVDAQMGALTASGASGSYTQIVEGFWNPSSPAAITSIKLTDNGGGTITGTFSLYGVN